MDIKTKYDIGDKMFWLVKRDGVYEINHDPIKSINIGGKVYEKYEISYTARAERDLFEKFEDAKKECLKKQKETNAGTISRIEDYKAPRDWN